MAIERGTGAGNDDSSALELPLPAFVRRSPSGLTVDLKTLAGGAAWLEFVDRIFSSGFIFAGGDYLLIQKLGFELEPAEIGHWVTRLEAQGKTSELLLARDVRPFSDERRALYRGWLIAQDQAIAEYFFEPIYIESEIEAPQSGDLEPGAEIPVERFVKRTVQEHVGLDIDEFIAAAWAHGIRFGWDILAIGAAITRNAADSRTSARVTVARAAPPVPGTDATLLEQTQALHRNDAPIVRGDGRVDLAQFRNHFPQIAPAARLLKKIPRTPGKAGINVDGRKVEPELPKDFSLDELSGPGTRVENSAEGEFIVSTLEGFLTLDAATSQIAVTDKIIDREGISARTIGNVSLHGLEFEEHGEVQERRTIEGMNMTFMADVFGHVVSRGGHITLKKHLSGGSARSDGGRIDVDGGASRALIQALGGDVHVKSAEGSTIVGRKVHVEHACLCTIVGDEVTVDRAEGCAIAGLRVGIGSAASRRETETTVVVLMPDLSATDRAIAESGQHTATIAAQIEQLNAKLHEFSNSAELKTYLFVQKKRASGEITMSPAQEAQFAQLSKKVAPHLKQIGEISAALKSMQGSREELEHQLAALRAERLTHLGALACDIEEVVGDTTVSLRTPKADEIPLAQMPARELAMRLRIFEPGRRPLFAANSGSFSWAAPEASDNGS